MVSRARWGRSDSLLVVAMVAGGVLLALLLGNDYGLSWDEPLIATYVGRLQRAYASLQSKDAVFVDLQYYGPLYFLIADGIAHGFRELLGGWSLVDGRHAAYFLSYVLATVSVFAIGRGLTGRWPAMLGALLMATQPLFFGHAFINPKDIPFLSVFTCAVASGMLAVGSLQARADLTRSSSAEGAPRHPTPALRAIAHWRRTSRPVKALLILVGLLALVLLVDILLLRRIVLPSMLALTRMALAGEAPGPIQALFMRLTTPGGTIPLEAYLHKVHGIHSRIQLFAEALVVVLALALLTSILSSRYRDLGRSFFLWWLAAAGLMGAATAVRVLGPLAGILVCGLLLLHLRLRAFPLVGLYWLLAAAVTYACWPYLWGNPIGGLVEAVGRASQFPWDAPVLFAGQLVRASELPRYYAAAILAVQLTLPAILLGVAGAAIAILGSRRRGRLPEVALLWIWLLLPFLPAIMLGSTVYDNARQLLFALPPLFILSSCAIEWILRALRSPLARGVVTILILLPGIVGIVSLHPYEYIYYNEFVGGVGGAFRKFELDYWVTGFREAMEFVNAVSPRDGTVGVAGARAAAAAFARQDINVWGQDDTGGPGRHPDFLVATTRWNADLTAWPEAPVLWRLERNGALLAVVKDLRGIE